MRIASFLIALVLIGCGPGPKSARGEDKSKESYTAAVARFEATVAGFAETQGNTNGELEAVKEELKALKGKVEEGTAKSSAKLEELESKLDAALAPAISVPQIHIDAPPPRDADKRTVTIDGKAEDLDAFIKKWYRPNQGFHDPDDGQVLSEHLVAHGVAAADVEGMNYATQHVLHVAVHMKEKADGTSAPKVAAKSKAKAKVKSAPVTTYRMPVQNCPNGRCPAPTYYYYR